MAVAGRGAPKVANPDAVGRAQQQRPVAHGAEGAGGASIRTQNQNQARHMPIGLTQGLVL